MSIYDDLQVVANEILEEFDQQNIKLITLTEGEGGTPDEPANQVETSYDLKAVVKGVSLEYVKYGFATESDLQIIAGVLSDVTPTLKDYIEIEGNRYKIVKDISTPAAGTRCVWKFIVRKGG